MSAIQLLRKVPFLKALSGPRLKQVYALARELAAPAGSEVFAKREEATSMFIVLEGRVKIFSRSPARKRKTFALLSKGDFFGEMALIEGTTRTASAQALEDSRLLVIRKKDFWNLLSRDQGLALYLLNTVCARLRRANEEIESLLFQNMIGRVAKKVFDLARHASEPLSGGGKVLRARYTQQELADMVGTTREPLTRALSSLRRAGLISVTPDGRYAVPDERRLAGLCLD